MCWLSGGCWSLSREIVDWKEKRLLIHSCLQCLREWLVRKLIRSVNYSWSFFSLIWFTCQSHKICICSLSGKADITVTTEEDVTIPGSHPALPEAASFCHHSLLVSSTWMLCISYHPLWQVFIFLAFTHLLLQWPIFLYLPIILHLIYFLEMPYWAFLKYSIFSLSKLQSAPRHPYLFRHPFLGVCSNNRWIFIYYILILFALGPLVFSETPKGPQVLFTFVFSRWYFVI